MAKRLCKLLSLPLLLLLVGSCATAPEPPEPPAEAALPPSNNEEMEALRQEITSLRRELQLTEAELAQTRERLSEAVPREESTLQLERENERLRSLVEELRLALIAAEGVEGLPQEIEPEEPEGVEEQRPQPDTRADYSFRQVDAVNRPLRSQTPAHLAAQGVERIPLGAGGYRYVDGSANESSGEGIYVELTLLPGMELPESALKAKTVYPATSERLIVERVTFALGGQSFELEPEGVERLRDENLVAEVARFPWNEEVRRLLTLTQRRAGAEMTVLFHGANGERTHEVSRRERLALANMIYTFREMGGEL